MRHLITFLFLASLPVQSFANPQVVDGLTIEPEDRCSSYHRSSQYPYPQSIEDEIVEGLGGVVYGPYTGRYYDNDRQTDIEHIVATSEAHDSGLCSASATTRRLFATDLLNLTLAHKDVNRCEAGGKCHYDPAEWMPERNKCWYANTVVEVKKKYGLSVDQAEADALRAALSNCPDGVEMKFYSAVSRNTPNLDALTLYDTNRNGRITCSEARSHGIAPVHSSHPAYEHMSDGDGDGVVCE